MITVRYLKKEKDDDKRSEPSNFLYKKLRTEVKLLEHKERERGGEKSNGWRGGLKSQVISKVDKRLFLLKIGQDLAVGKVDGDPGLYKN